MKWKLVLPETTNTTTKAKKAYYYGFLNPSEALPRRCKKGIREKVKTKMKIMRHQNFEGVEHLLNEIGSRSLPK